MKKEDHIKNPDMNGTSHKVAEEKIRINKFLSEAGVCSRREADRLAEAGRVTVNGITARPGMKAGDNDDVRLDGRVILRKKEEIFLMFNKPSGIVCTAAPSENGRVVQNVIDYIGYPERIFPVGRLDKDSEGLLLLTNAGEVADRILKSRYGHEKEYFVRTDREVDDIKIKELERGIRITDTEKGLDEITKPCRIRRGSEKNTFHMIIKQGLNRQIRRMFSSAGAEVIYLRRDRIMNLKLGDLKKGRYRKLTDREISELKKECGMEEQYE